MNETLKAIVRVLEEGTPELKVAASQVLGELSPKDQGVVQALSSNLTVGDNTLNRYILQALASIGSAEAIKILVGRMRDGGTTSDLVRHLMPGIAGPVAESLAADFENEPYELQQQIVHILGHNSDPSSMDVLVKAMFGAEEKLSCEGCDLLLARLQEVDEDRRKEFREKAVSRMKSPKDLTATAIANGLRVLAEVNVVQSRATLLKYSHEGQPPVIRQAALTGLAGASLTTGQSDTLLAYLEEPDLNFVVKPTMVALAEHREWSRSGINKLRALLSSRRDEMKLFALRVLRDVHTEEAAKIYMSFLYSPKPGLQEAAIEALSVNTKALAPMLKSLHIERNPEKVRVLIKPLKEQASRIKPPQVKVMAEKCGKLLADGSEMGETHLELLVAVNPDAAGQQLADKAVRLRRAHKLVEALRILMHLAQAEVLDVEGSYQLALARLIKDSEEGRSGMISYTGDATMGFIAGLVRSNFPVFERLKKESMLQPEDLLRVGRHFNASIGPEQRFGTDILVYVAQKHAKAKAGEEARLMIRTEGLG
ncbi:MAG: hypothetical protein VX951_09075 [Planctomycetota bacterium]|nr:hypothetical protein [Planctomycetota bacterium]